MTPLDWLFMAVPLLVVVGIAAYTQRYLKSVADFMAGGRLAGRYLICVARGEMGAGAVVFVAMFEIIANSGFTLHWWNWISVPVALVVAISGFVIYRYRETRALTLAQFFEIRYSKRFRLFAGGLAFVAGCFNFGIIPAVGARFFVYYLGLPREIELAGLTLPTYIPLMAVLLGITLFLTVSGGQITVMITDCTEGLMSMFCYLAITFTLLMMFQWSQIVEVLTDRPPGQSLLNPFDSLGLKDFNLWYVLMSVALSVYGTMAWQNASAYNSAAATPHESRMGNVLGRWREFSRNVALLLLAICAVTFLAHPDFATQAAPVQGVLDQIPDAQIQKQMRIPTALSYLLPIGIKGLLAAIVLMGIFGGDSTHLHSWGGIFVQDILVPLRKRPFGPRQHIRALRLGITSVAVFAFLFGSLFRQTEYVVMWFQMTMTMFIGGAGSAIVGGLYWKKGTTAGAWAAMLTGVILVGAGMVARQSVDDFPLNGVQISFGAALVSIVTYIVVSLLTCREDFNMDRMLHRGAYRRAEEASDAAAPARPVNRLAKLIGFDENFSRGDKWIAGGIFWWSMTWFVVFLIGTAWNLIAPWPDSGWAMFWRIQAIVLPVVLGVGTTIWFAIGVTRDMRVFFRRLREERVDDRDDGTVIGHRSMDEVADGTPSSKQS